MAIISSEFFLAVGAVLILYYIIPSKMQWPFLLFLSVGFLLLNSSATALLVFLVLITLAWGSAILIERVSSRKKTIVSAFSVTALAGILFFSKDLAFITSIEKCIQMILRPSGIYISVYTYPVLKLLGMSYFTLSLIGYVLDVTWSKYAAEKNPLKTMLFAVYFPQLVSGPITRYDSMRDELFMPHPFNADAIIKGAERTIWGSFEKIVIANSAALYSTSAIESQTGAPLVLGILFYALRLYADFAGSMDILLGISACFQIALPENFDAPFQSHSLSEFWRRWHITMGTWFKEYLLYPLMKTTGFQKLNKSLRKKLGKVYGKKIATCLGLIVLWFAIGIWHGGSVTFLVTSGMIPGFFLILEELMEKPMEKVYVALHINTKSKIFGFICRMWVLFAMCCCWTVMAAGSILKARNVVSSFFIKPNTSVLEYILSHGYYRLFIILFGLALMIIVGKNHVRGIKIVQWLEQKPIWIRWGILQLLLLIILVFGIYGPKFNLSDFIYKEF